MGRRRGAGPAEERLTLVAALREDALTATSSGFELRLGLPWIRSMPLSSVTDLRVSLDGQPVDPGDLKVLLADGAVDPADLVNKVDRWWYLQDRLVVTGPRLLGPGAHHATIDFHLLVPYLSAGPDTPLVLSHHLEADLDPNVTVSPDVAGDVI
jgi:Domain of unknown function (DUF6379)